MTQINKLIIYIFILLNGNLGYAETPEQQALDAVQQKYENILTFEASFTQRSYVKMMDKTNETKGKVQIKKPGMMKWVYGLPDTQVLISNGKILWHYVSDENQVVKVPIENIYSSNTPALFLAGQEKLTQIFNIDIPERTFQFQAPPNTEVLDYTKGP